MSVIKNDSSSETNNISLDISGNTISGDISFGGKTAQNGGNHVFINKMAAP